MHRRKWIGHQNEIKKRIIYYHGRNYFYALFLNCYTHIELTDTAI